MVMHTHGHLMMVIEPAKKPIIEPISFKPIICIA